MRGVFSRGVSAHGKCLFKEGGGSVRLWNLSSNGGWGKGERLSAYGRRPPTELPSG